MMDQSTTSLPTGQQESPIKGILQNKLVSILFLLLILFAFLTSLDMMSESFKLFGKDSAKDLIKSYLDNPFIGLFVGMLATAIVQSSSTTTSTVVKLIGSVGAVSTAAVLSEDQIHAIQQAIPMIMGANIGTSVTSTIVSIGHIAKQDEYPRAVAAATIHDFFNILVTLILFPLELKFNFLSNIAINITEGLHIGQFVNPKTTMPWKAVGKYLTKDVIGNGYIALPLAMIILFFSLSFLSKILKALVIGKSQERFEKVVFGSQIKSLLWGTGLTAAVQSSSVTTSMTVPLVATGKISLRKAFPFLLGANIGTTVTALMVAFANADKPAGIAIALCHLLFNIFGTTIFFAIPGVKNIPVILAEKLGEMSAKNRLVGIGYMGIMFFAIPASLIYFAS